MASAVFDLATILGALDQIDGHVGSAVKWRGGNPDQERLLTWRDRVAADVRKVRHLDGCASTDAEVLNRFLADREFAYRFEPLTPPNFGAAAALTEAARWPEVGTSVPLFAAGHDRLGFRLEGNATGHALSNERTLVAMTRGIMDSTAVWLLLGQIPDGSDGFELFEAAHTALAGRKSGERLRYASVTMPDVGLTATDEMPWLTGLAGDREVAIGTAVREARLRIDRTGSETVLAAAETMRSAPIGFARDLVVDKPFVAFWTDDSSPEMPLAVARFDLDTWSDWDPERADRENLELEAAEAAALKADKPPTGLGAVRRRLFGRK